MYVTGDERVIVRLRYSEPGAASCERLRSPSVDSRPMRETYYRIPKLPLPEREVGSTLSEQLEQYSRSF